jgi:hypothetical protein
MSCCAEFLRPTAHAYLLSDGNLNNIVGASLTFDTILLAKVLIVDKGHDFDYFREALEKFG